MRLITTHLSKIRMLSLYLHHVMSLCLHSRDCIRDDATFASWSKVPFEWSRFHYPFFLLWHFLLKVLYFHQRFSPEQMANSLWAVAKRLHDMSQQCNSTNARCPFQYFLGHAFYICFEFWCFLISFWPFPPEALHIFLFNLASCIFNSLEKQYTMHQCILSTICFDACIVCTKLT